MRKLPLLVVAIATVLGTVGVAFASDFKFGTHLEGSQEVPAVVTNAQGQAKFKLAEDETSIDFKLIVANIDDVTQAHIHCGTEGLNGGITVFLYGFGPVVSPDGILSEGTITAANVRTVAPSAACPGGIAAGDLNAVIEKIRGGGAYVNVHTLQNPGGQIRGQLP